MKFFGWMQSKFNGGHKDSKPATSAAHHMKQLEPHEKQEFSDWPQALLAIGTFGDLPITENDENNNTASSPDLSEFTPEEIGKLQKELKNLVSKKPPPAPPNNKQIGEFHDLPLDRFLNCPSSLEVDRRLSTTTEKDLDDDDDDIHEDIDGTIKVILGRCKDIISTDENSKKSSIGKKATSSISFLLKKMFGCSSGFPSINVPATLMQDHPLPESRMERLLRAMLKNKLNPQNSRASSAKKLIENRRQSPKQKAIQSDDEVDANDGSKWVKTDSEYIVLEI